MGFKLSKTGYSCPSDIGLTNAYNSKEECEERMYCGDCHHCWEYALYQAKIKEETKHGKWIERYIELKWCADDVDVVYECSVCGAREPGTSPYCPNCGAKMEKC